MNISLPESLVLHLQSTFPYRWASSTLDYLVIKLTPSYSSLFSDNFYPLLSSITVIMTSWRFPTISWIGRIHAVLLKILYFFWTPPVQVPVLYLPFLRIGFSPLSGLTNAPGSPALPYIPTG